MSASPDQISVLVVDDDPDFAELAATFLEREHEAIDVETATAASEGLEKLDGGAFDCVVSDYDMPGRNGLEFLAAVADEHPDLPFILFTGKGSEEIASEAITAGVTDYLQKTGDRAQYERLANRIVHAVTATRAARDAAAAEARYRAVVEGASDAIVTIDESSTIRFANEASERLFGHPREELEGKPLTELMPERFRERHREALQRYRQTGERTMDWREVEFPGLRADGREIPLSISFGEFDRGGERRFIGVIRRIPEGETPNREPFLERTHDALGEPFLLVEEGRVIHWNERCATVTGVAQAESTPADLREFFADADRIEAAIERALAEGEASVTARLVTANGERRPYRFVWSALPGQGERVGGVGRATEER